MGAAAEMGPPRSYRWLAWANKTPSNSFQLLSLPHARDLQVLAPDELDAITRLVGHMALAKLFRPRHQGWQDRHAGTRSRLRAGWMLG
ncbi:hypothetical protein K466DRAFT_668635 [Polyporus arcularius HHB13444]|uniref:Uncharacterized protein n=1 Tax=Polyporus arcularius HHB13444 TaxID=1314778 RepID=A0A5C3NM52_9APHY|nr:hypothetical protein K466DRAFT_668635 [Polyporus arcularius HHB13444]